eukprot:326192-Prymnesium_polylepis.1
MYGRPDHRASGRGGGYIWDGFLRGSTRTLACDPNQVYLITARKGLTGKGMPLPCLLPAPPPARLEAPVPLCAQSQPRDDPGAAHPRGVRAGGRQTAPPLRAA